MTAPTQAELERWLRDDVTEWYLQQLEAHKHMRQGHFWHTDWAPELLVQQYYLHKGETEGLRYALSLPHRLVTIFKEKAHVRPNER